MLRLENPIQNYAWGSHSAISELLGLATPSPNPEAELWMGAHPKAPSRIAGGGQSLADVIESDPQATLGAVNRSAFGARLPFLLKVLAAESPLSLQAHPSTEQAQLGFDREEARGVALDAAHRNYKDRCHKPELICALTPFDALCGFRAVDQTLQLFHDLAAPSVSLMLQPLREDPSAAGLARCFASLLQATPERRASLAAETEAHCLHLAERSGHFQREFAWAARIGALYPGDVGIVSALLLNLVQLQPGEAIFLPAGNLHAYLHGVGVEIMANSDNVLRAGLTPKHVDAAELLHVLQFQAGPVEVLQGTLRGKARVYETCASEFELECLQLSDGEAVEVAERRGPEILFCERGEASVQSAVERLTLARGQAVFVAAGEPSYRVHGAGKLFRASVGRS